MAGTGKQEKRKRPSNSSTPDDNAPNTVDASFVKASQPAQAGAVEPVKRQRVDTTGPKRWQSPLPGEIWDQIIEDLPLSDKGSLGLASYKLYQRFGETALQDLYKPSQYVERHKLLFRLYRQFPDCTLCGGCLAYHWNHDVQDDIGRALIYDWTGVENSKILLTRDFTAYYHEVQEWSFTAEDKILTDQHIKLPHCDIDDAKSFDEYDGGQGWSFGARLGQAGGRLLMCATFVREVSVKVLQDPRGLRLPHVCLHSADSPVLPNELRPMVDELPRPWEHAFAADRGMTSGIFRCTFCPTEVALRTFPILDAHRRKMLGATYEIKLIKFVDFGDMVVPHDRNWRALTRSAKEGVLEDQPFDLEGRESIASRALDAGLLIESAAEVDWSEELLPMLTKWSSEQIHGPCDSVS